MGLLKQDRGGKKENAHHLYAGVAQLDRTGTAVLQRKISLSPTPDKTLEIQPVQS